MGLLALLAVAAATNASPQYQVDLTRYFPSAAVEASERTTLMSRVKAFAARPAASLTTPTTLRDWLVEYDSLYKALQRHDAYIYLRAEENSADRASAAADAALGAAMDEIERAARNALARLGQPSLRAMMARGRTLAPYEYFIDSRLKGAAAERGHEEALSLLARPALDSLSASYNTLRRQALRSVPPASRRADAREAFRAKWRPYLENEAAFAALLVPVVSIEDGMARLQGFAGAPEAAYFRATLSASEVNGVLGAIRESDCYKRYTSVVAAAASRHLHVATTELHAWDLDAADTYHAPSTAFPDVGALIGAADRRMGDEYVRQLARLFDPANGRVEWCRSDECDDAGFSVGFAGTTSSLFYGGYSGTTNSVRAVAHEAGHAVHRQLMNENQPLAAYNSGPRFLSESFAILNGLLLLDHLYRSAPTAAARAYYLRQFLEVVTYHVFGSAWQTDLEQSIYAGVRDGTLRSATDLDAITVEVLSRYVTAPALAPEMKVFWARNRLYFADPLYDVNYLFAGLLALEYLRQLEHAPRDFARRYVALLKNGFTDTPQTLLKRFLGIDLNASNGLVADACKLIDARTSALKRLYPR